MGIPVCGHVLTEKEDSPYHPGGDDMFVYTGIQLLRMFDLQCELPRCVNFVVTSRIGIRCLQASASIAPVDFQEGKWI